MKLLWRALALVLLSAPGGAQSFTDRGEALLLEGKAPEALVFLEAAAAQNLRDERAALYLGSAYWSLGRLPEARRTLSRSADLGGPREAELRFVLALVLAATGLESEALAEYQRLLTLNPTHSGALLNRANLFLKTAAYPEAEEAYRTLLSRVPNHPQRPAVEQVLARLAVQKQAAEAAAAAAEAARLAEAFRREQEAEAARLAEESRAAEAARRAEEEARLAAQKAEEERVAAEERARVAAELARQQEELLARIRASLGGVGDETQSLKAGSAGVGLVEQELSLED